MYFLKLQFIYMYLLVFHTTYITYEYMFKCMYMYLVCTCIAGNIKNGFIVLPSHKIIVQKYLAHRKLYNLRSGRTCETQLSPPNVLCWPFVSSLPPHMVDHLICRGSYINWVLRNNSLVDSVAVTRSCDALVLTASSSSSFISNFTNSAVNIRSTHMAK